MNKKIAIKEFLSFMDNTDLTIMSKMEHINNIQSDTKRYYFEYSMIYGLQYIIDEDYDDEDGYKLSYYKMFKKLCLK